MKDTNIPTRCIDVFMKCCHICKYGVVKYNEDVESSSDLEGSCFEFSCMYGLENTIPTEEEKLYFDKWLKGAAE